MARVTLTSATTIKAIKPNSTRRWIPAQKKNWWNQTFRLSLQSRFNEPVETWSNGKCLDWLQDVGLSAYVTGASAWLRGEGGRRLMTVTEEDLERGFFIKVCWFCFKSWVCWLFNSRVANLEMAAPQSTWGRKAQLRPQLWHGMGNSGAAGNWTGIEFSEDYCKMSRWLTDNNR